MSPNSNPNNDSNDDDLAPESAWLDNAKKSADRCPRCRWFGSLVLLGSTTYSKGALRCIMVDKTCQACGFTFAERYDLVHIGEAEPEPEEEEASECRPSI